MKKIFNQICKEAEYMQDLRDDKRHARIVTSYAIKLCKILKADENIVVPAAILHDVGYYGMDRQAINDLVADKISGEEAKIMKLEHMKLGAEFATEILKKINYSPQLIEKIIDIIRSHDLDSNCSSLEDKVVRDADKLWRFSKTGFNADLRRKGKNYSEWCNYLSGNIDKENYFYTDEARKIALKELEDRRNEMGDAAHDKLG